MLLLLALASEDSATDDRLPKQDWGIEFDDMPSEQHGASASRKRGVDVDF